MIEQKKTWKRRSTSTQAYVEVDLDEFDTEELLQALINRGSISESDALAIAARDTSVLKSLGALNPDELGLAQDEFARGRRDEALIHLERFMGRGWIGALTGGRNG